jgi:outer membrane protein assembly factor BamB
MTDKFRVVDCPSCGAPLKMPRERKRLFQCEFCGTTLEDQTTPKERVTRRRPRVIIHSTTVSQPPRDLPRGTSRTGPIIGCVLLGLIVLGVVIFLVSVGAPKVEKSGPSDQSDTLRVYGFALAHLMPTDNDTGPDIVGVTRNSDGTSRMVYVDFDADPHLRWQSEPLGDGANYVHNKVVADRALIYMAYETTLVAFDRGDGTILWEATLSDEVSNICRDCLQIFDHWAVALTADGVLNGINVQTGEEAWSERLTATPRQLLNLAGKAAVLDEEDDVVGVNVYDPATGALARRIVPQCPNEPFPNRPQTLGIYDPLLVSGDGRNLYVPIGSYRPGCIQSWDGATLTQVWQTTLPVEFVRSLGREPHLLTDEALYISDGHNLSLVNLLDGAYREVFSDEDHDLVPLAAQDGVLVALAERTRGTRRYSLWGLDTATGSQRWEYIPEAQDLYDDRSSVVYDDRSSVVYDDGIWSAGVSLDKVIVLQAFSDPSFVNFAVLNLADGAQSGTNRFDLGDEGSSYWMQVLGWRRDRVYLVLDSRLRAIDFMTAAELAAWP